MQRAKYTSEFKEEAVRQVVDKGHSVVDVAKRLGENRYSDEVRRESSHSESIDSGCIDKYPATCQSLTLGYFCGQVNGQMGYRPGMSPPWFHQVVVGELAVSFARQVLAMTNRRLNFAAVPGFLIRPSPLRESPPL